ncbi:GNAT family N-acetyltransferase [Mesorhizobium salmacidum]|uniref:GNAT family N-acetyltransferase n=1 Tax=Mesorhizobium salmacidum TaxID=3015171 RepID=A0ABU8L464_9HYPH
MFIVEQNVPETVEQDAYDALATHLVAIAGGYVVGTLRIVFLTEHAKFGRVALLRQRGNGIAMRMMQAGMQIARSRGENRFYLTSQADKTALYEKLGFVACGDEFEEAGMPHRAMKNY